MNTKIININNDFHTLFVPQTSSTMDLAKTCESQCVNNGQYIYCVFAENQTQGRGRAGAQWLQNQPGEMRRESDVDLHAPASLPEQLTFASHFESMESFFSDRINMCPVTFVVPFRRIEIPMEWLTAAVGCALFDALVATRAFIQTLLPELPFRKTNYEEELLVIKWPNDLIFQNKRTFEVSKIAGILCETAVKGSEYSSVYIGLGLNFFEAPAQVPHALSFIDAVLFSDSPKKTDLNKIAKLKSDLAIRRVILARFAQKFQTELAEYLCVKRSAAQLKNLTLQRSMPLGTLLRVNKGLNSGKFAGLTDSGALVLEGHSEPILASDVAILQPVVAPISAVPVVVEKNSGSEENDKKSDGKKSGSKKLEPQDKNVVSGQFYLAIDCGNTRLHWSIKGEKSEEIHQGHLAYPDLQSSPRPWKELLIPLTENRRAALTIAICSVSEAGRDRTVLNSLESSLKEAFPEMKISSDIWTSSLIFSCMDLQEDYAEKGLGVDRALRFAYAKNRASLLGQSVIVFSAGTALTSEGMSEQGEIIESTIAPGLQMSLDALHQNTARLPLLRWEDRNKYDDLSTECSLFDGVFHSVMGGITSIIQSHSPALVVFSGGNGEDFYKWYKNSSGATFTKTPQFEWHEHLETESLLQLIPQKNLQSGNSSAQGMIRSMLKARMIQKDDLKIPVREEDFRRLGGRMENVDIGERLDRYLAINFPFHTRDLWRQRILGQEVRIQHGTPKIPNSNPIYLNIPKPTYKVRPFDQLWVFHPAEYEPDSIDTCEVVFDDGDVMAFSKPGNLVIHASGLYGKNTFVQIARNMGYADAAPVHRIDRETSGLLLCARTTQTRHSLSHSFRYGQMRKLYFAVTRGTRELPTKFKVDMPIGEAVNSAIRLKLWVNTPGALQSLTHFKKLSSVGEYTLMACLPQTGRTNQIRIHLAAIGHWIVGDKMYHADENVFLEFYEKGLTPWVNEQVEFPRHLLHNAGILCEGPFDLEVCKHPIVCPFTPDMEGYGIFKELLSAANIPLEHEAQKECIKNLFESLLKESFKQAETISELENISKAENIKQTEI